MVKWRLAVRYVLGHNGILVSRYAPALYVHYLTMHNAVLNDRPTDRCMFWNKI